MATTETATEIRPFRVEVPEEALDDLRRLIEAPWSWAGEAYPNLIHLRRSRQGRTLHRPGAAAAFQRGDPRGVPLTALARRSS
jgi:hypothetical protein